MMLSRDRDRNSITKVRMSSAVFPEEKKEKNDEIGCSKDSSKHEKSEVPSTSQGATTTPDSYSTPTRIPDDSDTNSGLSNPNSKRKLDDTDEECDETAKKVRSEGYRAVGADISDDPSLGKRAETSNQNSRYINRETYAASGLKRSLHGTVYQLKHLMLVVHRVWKKRYSFCLSTEMDAAEKFDDLVLEFDDGTGSEVRRFVQLKHKYDESKTISARQLLDTKDGDFSILKYFLSWRKINSHPNFGGNGSNIFILCTNIDVDVDELNEADIDVEVVQESDEFLRVTGRETQPPRYKLLVGKESELWNVLKSASDVHLLASVLAKRIHDSKEIDLKTGIFKDYHFALAKNKNVIDIESKKLSDNFIKNRNLSPNVEKFRKILFGNLRQLMRRKLSETEIQDDLEIRVLKLSGSFGKKFEPAIQPKLADVDRFSQQFVRLLNNGAGNDNVVEIKRQKRATDSSSERVFSDNIDKLAGHVLILEAGKIRFSRQFLEGDDAHLAGNIGEFRAALKRIFFNGFSDFGKFEFKINNFKTCTEEELTLKTELPDDYIHDDEIRRFLREFVLAVRQPNEVELGTMIQQEMGAYSQFNLLNADFIKDSFQNEILDWFKKTGKECEFLKNKDADAFFDKVETKLSSLITIGLNAPYPAELERFDVRYVSEISDLHDFLDASNCTRKPILELISPNQTLLTALRVYQTLAKMDKYEKNDSYIFLHLDKLILPKIESQVLSAFKSQDSHDLLVVDCELISSRNAERRRIFKLWDKLAKVVDRNPSKRIILIIQGETDSTSEFEDDSETHHEKDDDVGINNLQKYSRQKLLEKKVVNFQGPVKQFGILQEQVKKTSFADLLDIHDDENHETENSTDLGRIIDPNTLIQLIKGEEIRIGSEVRGLEDVKDYYIDRTIFRHVIIKAEILRTPGISDLFAISCFDGNALKELVRKGNELDTYRQSNESELGMNEFVILENGREKEHFINLCQQDSSRNVHWLEGEGTEKLIWKETFGNIDSLIEFEEEYKAEGEYSIPDNTCHMQDQLFTGEEQPRIIILSGVAGMGKSTLLSHLGGVIKRHKPNTLVIRIDLTRHTDELAKRQEDRNSSTENTDEAVDFLVDELLQLETHTASETYKAMIKGRGEVVLLFDGFDEISPKYADTVTELLRTLAKCQIKELCVTTRPHSKKLLEVELGTFRHIMQPFNQENQMEFLTSFWRKHPSSSNNFDPDIEEVLRERAAAVIEMLRRSINIQMQEFTGIPLQTKLVAEGFPYDGKETLPDTVDIVDLYQRFIDKKYQILFSEKKPGKETNLLEGDMRKITRKIYLMRHEKLALDALFAGATVKALLSSQPEVERGCQSFWDKNEDEERTGIVKTGKPVEFIHRTFAEYLAAVFLHRTLIDDERNQQVRTFFVSQLLLQREHETIRAFMNCILMRESNTASHNENKSWDIGLHDKRNPSGGTLFHVAVEERNIGILKFFLARFKKHQLVTRLSTDGVVVQKETSSAHKSDDEDLSVDYPVDFDLNNGFGLTPLGLATIFTAHDVVTCLVEGGANIHCDARDGQTTLHLAAQSCNLDLVKYFVGKGVDINYRAKDDRTPLHLAARSGGTDVMKYLVEKGADINCRNRNGETPLHTAAESRQWDVVKYLVKIDGDINCQDKDGKTPLHIAAKSANWDVIEWFIKKGADTHRKTRDGKTPLHLAAQSGNLEVVKYFIDKDTDINCQTRVGETPLHKAVRSGKVDVVKYLVERGADVNYQARDGRTALHSATASNDLDMIKYLIEKGANMNYRAISGETPLHMASRSDNWDIVKFFVEKGANIHCQAKGGATPLHVSALSGNCDIVKYLIDKGADIHSRTGDGKTPLHMTARFGNWDIVEHFLEEGADINCQTRDRETLLHLAGRSGNLEVVEYLVEKGADINCQTASGETPLYSTARSGNWDVVKYFVEKGANINCQTKDHETLLHMAASSGYWDDVKYLVEKGANVNCQALDGKTLLHLTARSGNLDLVKYFVQKGADIDCSARHGETSLHMAAESGDSDVVQYLVEKGADILRRTGDGRTPLHMATRSGNLDVVKCFIEKGADINVQARSGETPLYMTSKWGRWDVAEYLVDKGADLHRQAENGRTPLHMAALFGKWDSVKYFVNKGADMDCHTVEGETPLHMAVRSRKWNVAKYFVEKGADINYQAKDGRTPLHMAAESGNWDMVKYFVEKGADIHRQAGDGKTPLHIAIELGYSDVAKFVVAQGAEVNHQNNTGQTPSTP